LKISIAQLTSTDDFAANLRMVKDLYLRAAAEKSELAVFPENTLYLRIQSGSKLKSVDLDGPEFNELKNLVDSSGTSLMLTTPLKAGDKFSNSTVLLNPKENPRVVYSKIHLFDVDVEGAPRVRESDHFVNGSEAVLIDFRGWKLGLSICYDLRFPELYLNYAQEADLILVPSAFLVPTGEAHWHVLLRARAIESQCYVAAPAQSGEHISHLDSAQVRKTFGHSLIVDPWGHVLEEIASGLDIRTVELARTAIEKARRQIPMKAHRRL
jgi:predicted amidohydrolase